MIVAITPRGCVTSTRLDPSATNTSPDASTATAVGFVNPDANEVSPVSAATVFVVSILSSFAVARVRDEHIPLPVGSQLQAGSQTAGQNRLPCGVQCSVHKWNLADLPRVGDKDVTRTIHGDTGGRREPGSDRGTRYWRCGAAGRELQHLALARIGDIHVAQRVGRDLLRGRQTG